MPLLNELRPHGRVRISQLGSGISLSQERCDKVTPPGQITAAKLRKEVALTQSHALQISSRACLDDGIQPRLARQVE